MFASVRAASANQPPATSVVEPAAQNPIYNNGSGADIGAIVTAIDTAADEGDHGGSTGKRGKRKQPDTPTDDGRSMNEADAASAQAWESANRASKRTKVQPSSKPGKTAVNSAKTAHKATPHTQEGAVTRARAAGHV